MKGGKHHRDENILSNISAIDSTLSDSVSYHGFPMGNKRRSITLSPSRFSDYSVERSLNAIRLAWNTAL